MSKMASMASRSVNTVLRRASGKPSHTVAYSDGSTLRCAIRSLMTPSSVGLGVHGKRDDAIALSKVFTREFKRAVTKPTFCAFALLQLVEVIKSEPSLIPVESNVLNAVDHEKIMISEDDWTGDTMCALVHAMSLPSANAAIYWLKREARKIVDSCKLDLSSRAVINRDPYLRKVLDGTL